MSTHATLWRYVLRARRSWAIIVLGSDGFFSAVSDWGCYAFMWSAHGEADFRRFFLGKDFKGSCNYFARKLSPHSVYDEERTFQSIRRRILEGRRSGALSALSARTEWDHFQEVAAGEHGLLLKDVRTLSEWDFRTWWEGTLIGDASDCAVYGDDPRAVGFVTTFFPLLAEEVRWDLEAEACARGEVAHG